MQDADGRVLYPVYNAVGNRIGYSPDPSHVLEETLAGHQARAAMAHALAGAAHLSSPSAPAYSVFPIQTQADLHRAMELLYHAPDPGQERDRIITEAIQGDLDIPDAWMPDAYRLVGLTDLTAQDAWLDHAGHRARVDAAHHARQAWAERLRDPEALGRAIASLCGPEGTQRRAEARIATLNQERLVKEAEPAHREHDALTGRRRVPLGVAAEAICRNAPPLCCKCGRESVAPDHARYGLCTACYVRLEHWIATYPYHWREATDLAALVKLSKEERLTPPALYRHRLAARAALLRTPRWKRAVLWLRGTHWVRREVRIPEEMVERFLGYFKVGAEVRTAEGTYAVVAAISPPRGKAPRGMRVKLAGEGCTDQWVKIGDLTAVREGWIRVTAPHAIERGRSILWGETVLEYT